MGKKLSYKKPRDANLVPLPVFCNIDKFVRSRHQEKADR